MARPGHLSSSAEEQRQLAEVLAASAAASVEEAAAQAQLDSDLEAALKASKELERVRAREEADRGVSFLEAKQRAEEEEVRRKAAEEEAQILERLGKLKAEQEEAKRKAQEAEAKRKAEDEEARRIAEEEISMRKAAELDAARRKHQDLEGARRKAIVYIIDEEEARRKAEEAEAKRKAEAEAGKSWLELAMEQAGRARQLEDQDQTQEAMEKYRTCAELFGFAHKKEKSERVRAAVQEKILDMQSRAERLSQILMDAEASRAAEILAGALAVHPQPQTTLDANAARAAQLLAGTKCNAGYMDTAVAAQILARGGVATTDEVDPGPASPLVDAPAAPAAAAVAD